jgi:uncharacterized membrane protein YhaH (DUF805 family)
VKWYLAALRKYATFSGRASRSEFWYYVLFAQLIIPLILLALIAGAEVIAMLSGVGESTAVSSSQTFWELLYGLYTLGVLLPSVAVSVRRLHDIGASGWWLLIAFIPLAGMALLAMYLIDSSPGPNRFGPNPKGIGATSGASTGIAVP